MVSAHTYTFGHVYYDPPTPLCVYTLVIILYFSTSTLFIVFCIYCTHLLQKYKFTLHLTVQNQSEIVSKFAQTFASSQYHTLALHRLTQTCTHFTYTHICVVHLRLICIYSIHLHTYSSSLLIHSLDLRRVDLTLAHLDLLFYGVLFGLIQTL